MPEDLTDWENVRRQALALLKVANRKLGRAPSDLAEPIGFSFGLELRIQDDLTADTVLLVHPVSGREVGRIFNLKSG